MFARKAASKGVASRLRPEPVPRSLFVRTFLFGFLAILGALWALHRHYTVTPPPMLVPVTPRPAATYDADAGEVPVPDEWLDPSAKPR